MRIMYLIKNAIRGIFGNLKGNVIFALVLCVSLAPAIFICGMLEQSQFNIKLASYTDRNVTWILEFFEKHASEDSIREMFYEICPDLESCEFQLNDEEIVFYNGNRVLCNVSGISAGYLEVEGNTLLEGSDPWDAEAYAGKCLLRENSTLIELGAVIGDRIEIGGQSYEVAGIVKIPYGYGGIYVPFDSFSEGKSGSTQYKVLISGGDDLEKDEVKCFLTERTDTVLSVSRAVEVDQMYEASVIANIKKRADIFSLILVFALLGIIVTGLEKIYEDRYRLGVELACGATKKQILAEVTIQNLIIGLIVIGVDAFLLELSRVLFNLLVIKAPGIDLLFLLYLVMGVILFIVTAVCLFLLFHKKTEVELLNEGYENVC